MCTRVHARVEASSKSPTIIQVRVDDDGLDQGGSDRGGQRWLEARAVLKIQPKGFPNRLDVGRV